VQFQIEVMAHHAQAMLGSKLSSISRFRCVAGRAVKQLDDTVDTAINTLPNPGYRTDIKGVGAGHLASTGDSSLRTDGWPCNQHRSTSSLHCYGSTLPVRSLANGIRRHIWTVRLARPTKNRELITCGGRQVLRSKESPPPVCAARFQPLGARCELYESSI